MFIILANLIML